MANERASINIGKDGNLELLEIFFGDLLRAPIGTDAGKLAHDQSFYIRTGGFVVFGVSAVVADLRIG